MDSEKSSCLLLPFLDISYMLYCVYVLTHALLFSYLKANIHDFFERHTKARNKILLFAACAFINVACTSKV